MAINTYSDLKTALANWLARSDLTSYLDDFIDLAEERLARDLFTRYTQTAAVVELGSNNTPAESQGHGAVPADLLRVQWMQRRELPYPGNVQLIEFKPWDWLVRNFPIRPEGQPRFAAIHNDVFEFRPFPDNDSYSFDLQYWKKPTALSASNETNEWTDNFPDAVFWACLCESAPFLGNDERALMWEAKYDKTKDRIMTAEKKLTRQGTMISHDVKVT